MRPLWKDILAAAWIGIIIPGMVMNLFVWKEKQQVNPPVRTSMEEVHPACQYIPITDQDGNRSTMDLDRYLTGVLLAEIPTAFHMEALKAQAVAARTYAWKAFKTGGKHGDGSICTDSACCQAYLSGDNYLLRGGTQEELQKVTEAVRITSPIVLGYDGELIEATYFSSSGGNTEAALSVWGADYPYLQSVSSPEEPDEFTVMFTPEEFQMILGKEFNDDPEIWIGSATYTEGGGVDTLEICGESYTGTELRALFGLRSTSFRIRTEDSGIQITTRGYGHRVGMSQYGANAMAEAGSTWQQILQHYYPGTILFPAY